MNFIEGLKQNSGRKALLIFLPVLVLLPQLFSSPADVGMFISCGIASALAMGWLLIFRIGCVSLGQVAFLAIGAYTSALLNQKLGLSPWLGLLFGGVLAGLVAFGIGMIFLKMSGLTFAIITFAFAEVIRLVFSRLDFFGGHGGIARIPQFPPLHFPGVGRIQFDSANSNYYILLVIIIISSIVIWRMDHSALSRTFKSLPQNESLAQSLGINPLKYKLISFVTACFWAGVLGAFTAHYYSCIYPGTYSIGASIIVQIQATVGGISSVVFGAILGGSLMVMVENYLLRVDSRLIPIFYGGVIILVTFCLPNGLLSLSQVISKWQFPWKRRKKSLLKP
jgi:branched-chain amino acid transport system permease protein